jgi:hypothetical protein
MLKFLLLATLLGLLLSAQPYTDPIVRTDYHLTARPWKPLVIPRAKYLDAIEGEARYSIQHQNKDGPVNKHPLMSADARSMDAAGYNNKFRACYPWFYPAPPTSFSW